MTDFTPTGQPENSAGSLAPTVGSVASSIGVRTNPAPDFSYHAAHGAGLHSPDSAATYHSAYQQSMRSPESAAELADQSAGASDSLASRALQYEPRRCAVHWPGGGASWSDHDKPGGSGRRQATAMARARAFSITKE